MPSRQCPVCKTQFFDTAGTGECPYCGYRPPVGPMAYDEQPGGVPAFQPDEASPDVLPISPSGVPYKRRWFGHVSSQDWRGVLAIVMLSVIGLLVFLDPLIRTVQFFVAGAPADQQTPPITDVYFVFVFTVNTVIFILLPVGYLLLVYPRGFSAVVDEMRLRWAPMVPVWALVGVVATMAALVSIGLVLQSLIELGVIGEQPTSETVLAIKPQLNWFWIVAIPVVAALTEEIFFRGFLQPRIGLFASSILFGIVHIGYGTVLQVVAPFLLGLLFAYLYLKTKTLWAPIAGHFAFNFVQLTLLHLMD